MKKLVVNADDFGFTRDVNRGIVQAHAEGILTATTLMATGAAFDDAVRLAREHPALDIGVHLVLVGEAPFPRTIPRLLQAVALGRVRIHEEFVQQVRRVLDAGIQPTHLDTHKHTHLLPPVLEAVARISQDFKIPWVRRPFDLRASYEGVPWTQRAVGKSLLVARGRFARVLSKYGCRSTDHFAGFQVTGRYDAVQLARLIQALPDGTTEFMCHPGVCGDELRAARTRLQESRQRELEALTSREVRLALAESGVQLARYRDL